MIVFNGYLSGTARNFFIKRTNYSDLFVLFFASVIVTPFTLPLCRLFDNYYFALTPMIVVLFVIVCNIVFNKSMNKWIPKQILIEKDCVISISDKNVESKKIYDIKAIYEYDEFYYIAFPFGKITHGFICQKNLISKGTIFEFETMFKSKIIRKNK